MFDDGVGINSGRCSPLYSGSRFVAWVHAYHRVDSRFFVQRCDEAAPTEDTPVGVKNGSVSDDFVELSFDAGRNPAFSALNVPMWSQFANPVFCGPYMAYWGLEEGEDSQAKIHAVVFDLNRGLIVRRAYLGARPLESDSRDFFERPTWNQNQSTLEVFFCGRSGNALDAPSGISSHKFTLPTPAE
jgi:hypothetical protein